MIDIYLPFIKEGIFRHKDDSFREIVLEWGKRGLVNVIRSNEPYIWWGQKNDILLYDWDTFMWYNKYTPKYNIMLCGNEKKDLKNSSTWIYWAKHACNLENLNVVPLSERQITSIFVGRIENEVQAQYRHNDWKKYIEIFDILVAKEGLPYKYTNKEYIDLIRYSKFGLCLRGFGPKCLREIELMACGTIPIITPEVDIFNYYNPPIENIHYIRINKPEDIPIKINAINEEKWKQMSKACVQWYNQNCSVQGSFDMTNQIINNFKFQNQQIKSITTLTNKNGIFDLTILLNSLEKFHKDIPVFIACDITVQKHFDKNNYRLKLFFDACLDKYDGMNEEQMKQKGVFTDFKLEKVNILKSAISEYSNSLFIDSKVCLLDCLPVVDLSKDVILCYNNTNENKDENFNDSYFFVNNIKFLEWFRTNLKTLDYCYEEFKVGYFPIQNNFGWWRLYECDNSDERIRKFTINDGIVLYDNKCLKSVHTHFSDMTDSLTGDFNKFLITFFEKTDKYNDILALIKKPKETPLIDIIIQSYNEKDPERMNELTLCILHNLENSCVKNVYNLFEGNDDNYLNKFIKNHPKYIAKSLSKRLTYLDAFNFVNENLEKNTIVGLLNLDIMLEETFNSNQLSKVLDKNVIIANSRNEIEPQTGRIYLDTVFSKAFHAHTQDAWFFRTPIHIKPDVDVDFELGLLGCDNAIAHRLKMCDYTLYNMPERFKVIHVDNIRGKNSDNFKQFHASQNEKKKIVLNKKPEKNGCALVPNYDAVKNISIDSLIKSLNYNEQKRVLLISHILSQSVSISNN